MPAPANVAEFIEVVRKSGLVPDDRLQAELGVLRNDPAATGNIDQLATALVRDGLLTRFQAKQIKLGRYKRFTIAEKYRLLELLGVGGMGAVYLCEHMFMKRLVALKVLPVEKMDEPSAIARFYREARAVAAMDNPNIVRAYDIDKYEQLHFLVMEYVDGTSLQEIVAKHGPMDPLRIASYMAQAAHGLQHAHELNLVHRDIKPGNLLLDRSGTVKILDMGLARFFDTNKHDNLTEKFDNNAVLGTADYLAPEQAMSSVVDIRADIYALGGSMYFMLTGQVPFPEGTIAQKLMAHQTKEPKPVAAFRRDVPPELLAVLHNMMRKNPNERYQTPADLFHALAPWYEQPIPPPPAHEMPELCPIVAALAGPADRQAKASSSSKHPLSAARQQANSNRNSLGGRSSLATDSLPGTGPLDPMASQAEIVTARSSTTAPLGPPASNGHATPPPPVTDSVVEFLPPGAVPPPRANRKSQSLAKSYGGPQKKGRPAWMIPLFAGLGVMAFILLGVVGYVAFSGGKGVPTSKDGELIPEGDTISADDVPKYVDRVKSVSYTVRDIGGTSNIQLESTKDRSDPKRVTTVIAPEAVKQMQKKLAERNISLTMSDRAKAFGNKQIKVVGLIVARKTGSGYEITVKDIANFDLSVVDAAP